MQKLEPFEVLDKLKIWELIWLLEFLDDFLSFRIGLQEGSLNIFVLLDDKRFLYAQSLSKLPYFLIHIIPFIHSSN